MNAAHGHGRLQAKKQPILVLEFSLKQSAHIHLINSYRAPHPAPQAHLIPPKIEPSIPDFPQNKSATYLIKPTNLKDQLDEFLLFVRLEHELEKRVHEHGFDSTFGWNGTAEVFRRETE